LTKDRKYIYKVLMFISQFYYMDDIREKLDKIKIAIADEGKDLTLYTAEQLS